jgi:hypothetical protein
MDAAFPVYDEEEHLYVATGEQHAGMIAAAALRAVADQMAKADPLGDTVEDCIRGAEREHMRGKFYTLATELENHK